MGLSPEKIVRGYYVLYQTCSDKVRLLGVAKTQVLYDEAYKKWRSDPTNPLVEPPRNNDIKRTQHYAKCDKICGMEPKTIEDFACWAGIQVIRSQELDGVANKHEVWNAAHNLASKEYIAKNPEVAVLPKSPDPQLPSHLLSAYDYMRTRAPPPATRSVLSSPSPPEDVTDTLLDQKLKDLKYFLSIDGHPSRIWSQYTGLLNHLRHQNLPPEIHQQVLRKCTPPSTVLRPASGRNRITLPILEVNRPKLVAQTKKMTAELLDDMQKYRLAFTSVNLDLCMRILKETLDYEGFDCLMKWGYGIDLSNPDRVPLEYLGIGHRTTTADIPEVGLPALLEPLPFSTAALNTTIDMLGRFVDVSRLVQAFEVLTQPLSQASQHFSSFDDDDFGVPVTPPPVSLPYAEPNTTTFSLLIRHLCQKGHATLARHYILQLIDLDKKSKHSLRVALRSKARDRATAPRIAANRGSFIAVFHESNCDKNVGLMRWSNTKPPKIVRKKQTELEYFVRLREYWIPRHQHDILNANQDQESSPLIPESSLEHVPSPPLASSSSTPTTERKPFDINLHILERDWRELEELRHRVDDVLGRTIQRVKERLGRRVWGEKDLYLRSEGGRVNISRDKWADIANFRPRRDYVDEHDSLNTTPSTNLRSYQQPHTIPRHDSTRVPIAADSTSYSPESTSSHETRGRSI